MALPNPTVLSAATQFRPISLRNQSHSPARSRSPVRRNEFIAKELDPILGNLSPDTTLRALQSTDTIANSSAHDAILAKSITEASPTERELGIKAAVAAQKLRQWHMEVAQWPWPSLADAAAGKGFLQPEIHDESSQKEQRSNPGFAGSLPTATAIEYEDRIEEIYDGLDALEIEELKDAVLDSHSSFRLSPSSDALGEQAKTHWSQSKIRDFTALVTATIIHMLPDLANLNMLISSWDVRLNILRQTPQLLDSLQSTERGLQAAANVIADPKLGPLVTRDEVDTTENILAGQVSSLGTQYDHMLDLLEGHHDSLPAEWIDRLEEIENDFAHFVVDAKRRVTRNEWLAQGKQLDLAKQLPIPTAAPVRTISQRRGVDEWLDEAPASPRRFPSLHGLKPNNSNASEVPVLPAYESPIRARQMDEGFESDQEQTPLVSQGDQPFLFPPTSSQAPSRKTSQRVPSRNPSQRNAHSLTLDMPPHGHRRDISEVSMADSQYSAISGISNAEIVDARSTQVLASPKIQLVDNPMRASRDDLCHHVNEGEPRVRSMHILGREAYTRVESNSGHNRAKSLSISGPPPQYDPSQPLPSLPAGLGDFSPVVDSPTSATFGDSPSRATNHHRASTASVEMLSRGQARQISLARPSSRDSSHLLDEYHGTRSRSDTLNTLSSDELMAPGTDGRQHTESSHNIDDTDDQDETGGHVSPARSTDGHRDSFLDEASSSDHDSFTGSGENLAPAGSLEAKIQSILTMLPTRIRLARESDDSDSPGNPSSTASTRSSTPAPFTLSPVRADRSARGAVNDAGVKVYHLRRNGQSKEAKPTKLFVRRVGDEGRVMVRVGGGWADLGEYLREYSLHHGRRSIANGQFEVANLPNSGQREVPEVPVLPSSSASSSRSPSSAPAFDFGSSTSIPKSRQNFAPDFSGPSADDYAAIAHAPEPLLPANYTSYAPTSLAATSANGSASSTLDYPVQPTDSTHSRTTVSDGRSPASISSMTTSPTVSTTTAFPSSPLSSNQTYTPLGAAGPKNGNRRVTTHGGTSTAENEAWVDNLVGKARVVSGGRMPQTVTTPVSRRASGNLLNSKPKGKWWREWYQEGVPTEQIKARIKRTWRLLLYIEEFCEKKDLSGEALYGDWVERRLRWRHDLQGMALGTELAVKAHSRGKLRLRVISSSKILFMRASCLEHHDTYHPVTAWDAFVSRLFHVSPCAMRAMFEVKSRRDFAADSPLYPMPLPLLQGQQIAQAAAANMTQKTGKSPARTSPSPTASFYDVSDEEEQDYSTISHTSSSKGVKLLFSKSKVYVHPTPSAKDNIPGFIALVQQKSAPLSSETDKTSTSKSPTSKSPSNYLLAWVPESTLAGDDLSTYVKVDMKDGESPPKTTYFVPPPPVSSTYDDSNVGPYAFSLPLSSIYSILVRPPSLGWWFGSVVINTKSGSSLPALFFHDSECESTILQKKRRQRESFDPFGEHGGLFWGGDEVVRWLKRYINVERSAADPSVYLIDPSEEDKIGFGQLRKSLESQRVHSKERRKSQGGERNPQPAGAGMDPLTKALKETRWKVLEQMSKITTFARRTAQDVANNDRVPPQMRRLLQNPEVQTIQDEFDSARLYLARWAMGIAEQSDKEKRQRIWTAKDVLEMEESSVGEFEILDMEAGRMSLGGDSKRKPVSMKEWKGYFDSKGKLAVTEDEIKERVFHGGLDPEDGVRKEAWLFLLGIYDWQSTAAERKSYMNSKRDEFIRLKGAWWDRMIEREALQEEDEWWKEQKGRIEKDVHRTDRHIPLFAGEDIPHPDPTSPFHQDDAPGTNVHLEQLKDMLLTYLEYDTPSTPTHPNTSNPNPQNLGYVQGMSDLLSPLYAIFQDDAVAFWAFCNFMTRMSRNFVRSQSGMRSQLSTLDQLVQILDPQLYLHLQSADSTNFFFFFRMLLVWYKREFDWTDILRLWEGLWTDYLSSQFHLFIAVAILEKHRDVIMNHLKQFDEVLKYINELSGTIDLQSTLLRAEGLFRRFERTVQAVDKKDNFPQAPVMQRKKVTSGPGSLDAFASGSDVRPTSAEGEKKPIISPELRLLLSREVIVLDPLPDGGAPDGRTRASGLRD